MNKKSFMPYFGKQNAEQEPALLEIAPLPDPIGFEEASGALPYRMTNDAMFHLVFEACPEALKAFVGALLHLKEEEIISIEVTNPVTYGMIAHAKVFVLDLKIFLNGSSILNIEMQVENLSFWKERSLAYLCRAFDDLNRGDEYLNIKSAIQVGILNFNLSPEEKEFYSSYYMINEITQKKYSDKLRLSVLQLKQIANATEEDKRWHLDLWAKFFKAKTWEEVFMIAEKDPQIKNAARTLYRASTEDRIRNLCEGREKGEKTLRSLQLELQQSREALQQKDKILQQSREALLEKDKILQQTNDEIVHLQAQLAALQQQKK